MFAIFLYSVSAPVFRVHVVQGIRSAFRSYEFLLSQYMDDWLRLMLVTLAKEWVFAHLRAWQDEAVARAVERAKERFGLTSAKGFPLFEAAESDPDWPPEQRHVITLLVGDYVALRRGFVLDLKATSYSVALTNQRIITFEKQPQELEFYFVDVVTVSYTRNPEARRRGVFRVVLTNGEPLEYDTLEDGSDSAVEEIRLKTREVKAYPEVS